MGNTLRLGGSSHLAMPVILWCFPRPFLENDLKTPVLLAAQVVAVAVALLNDFKIYVLLAAQAVAVAVTVVVAVALLDDLKIQLL